MSRLDPGWHAERPSLTARAAVLAFLGVLLVAKASQAVDPGIGGEPVARLAAVVAIFAVQLCYVVPRLRGFQARHAAWILSAQAVLTYSAFAVFGEQWLGGMSGFLAGALLLAVAAPASWLLAGAVLVVEGVLWIGVLDVGNPADIIYYLVAVLNISLTFFVLTRLADLVREVHGARDELARLALERERLRIEAELRTLLDTNLTEIIDTVRRSGRLSTGEPARAATQIAAAAGTARRTLADVRSLADDIRRPAVAGAAAAARTVLAAAHVETVTAVDHPPLAPPAEATLAAVVHESVLGIARLADARRCTIDTTGDGATVRLRITCDGTTAEPDAILGDRDGLAGRVAGIGGALTATTTGERFRLEVVVPMTRRATATPPGQPVPRRLAAILLILFVSGFGAVELGDVWDAGFGAGVLAAIAVDIVAIAGLQLRHSTAVPSRGRPPGWIWTLAAQALLTYLPMAVVGWRAVHMAVFLAGSVLLLVPRPWSWVVFAGIAAGEALGPGGLATDAYFVAVMVLQGLVVYGLAHLADQAVQLEAARRELARMAVLAERLRLGRDLHDLLGLGLSTIALKCDLIGRLIERDGARVGPEIEQLLEICTRARAQVRSVIDDRHRLSLRAELAAAREVLTAAGVDVRVDGGGDLIDSGTAADGVLAVVLREATTNILRHADARRCAIRVRAGGGELSLSVSNDGAPERPGPHRRGRGLANLTSRIEAVGGRFAVVAGGGRYEVVARIPVEPGAAVPPAGAAGGR